MEHWSQAELARLGRTIRKARGRMSQEKLGEAAEIHRTYIGKIELGRVNLSWIYLSGIAKALGLKPSALLKKAGM